MRPLRGGVRTSPRLDSTLVMLGHRLRGVTVVRRTVPMIDAYAGELNQVWTNLINNAVDAMCGSCTTRVENGEVVIEIGDTGARCIVVERHGGKISIDSRPRETILRVELRVRQSESR